MVIELLAWLLNCCVVIELLAGLLNCCVVIELLAGLLNCCVAIELLAWLLISWVVIELVVFSELCTQNRHQKPKEKKKGIRYQTINEENTEHPLPLY